MSLSVILARVPLATNIVKHVEHFLPQVNYFASCVRVLSYQNMHNSLFHIHTHSIFQKKFAEGVHSLSLSDNEETFFFILML